MFFIWLFLYGAVMLLSAMAAPLFPAAPHVGLPAYTLALAIWILATGRGRRFGLRRPEGIWKRDLFFLLCLFPVFYNLFRFGFSFPEGMSLLGVFGGVLLEEIVFRGILPQWLYRRSRFWGMLLSSLAFGIAHIINLESGMPLMYILCQVIFAVAVGFALCGLRLHYKSIFPGAVIHLLINVTAGGIYDFFTDPLFWVCVAACFGCGVFLWKKGETENVAI